MKILWASFGAVLALAASSGGAMAAPAEPKTLDHESCLDCHADNELTKELQDGSEVSMFVDSAKFIKSVHAQEDCKSCHSDIQETHPDDEVAAKKVDCAECHEQQSKSYGESVHGIAVQEGDGSAANCVDCHGSHEVSHPSSPLSPLHRSNLIATCGECHPEVAEQVLDSVHGAALTKGLREAPSCLDCHFEHQIEQLKDIAPLRISQEVCSRCHASERINTKFNMPGDRVKTFFESYHGLAARFGSTRAANCASCHGVHSILPSSDPRSMIHSDRLVETCGSCHPGATEKFVSGKIHIDLNSQADLGSWINTWVRRIYIGLIVGTIGFMLVHNGLAWLKKLCAARRAPGRTVIRMNRTQRLQHAVLFVSFTFLVVSGFALTYPNSWISWLLGSNEDVRRIGHRVAGVVLMAAGLFHVFYAVFTREGRKLIKDFWPAWKDLGDLGRGFRYFVSRKAVKPKFGRFGYAEKFEYWAVVWGTVIMGVTGLAIWFKMDVTQFAPRWVVDVATTIHFYEAILATLAIIVWHFYHVMFDPDVYPLNFAALDGKVSKAWYKEEHSLDSLNGDHGGQPSVPEHRTDRSLERETASTGSGEGI